MDQHELELGVEVEWQRRGRGSVRRGVVVGINEDGTRAEVETNDGPSPRHFVGVRVSLLEPTEIEGRRE